MAATLCEQTTPESRTRHAALPKGRGHATRHVTRANRTTRLTTVLDTTSSCSAPPARRASRPSSASPRYLLSTSNVLIKSHAFSHTTQTKFKEEDDDFLNKLHRQQGQSV